MRRNESPLCDKYLIPKRGAWYKSFDDLVTNGTHPFSCETEMGIWMNGKLKASLFHHLMFDNIFIKKD